MSTLQTVLRKNILLNYFQSSVEWLQRSYILQITYYKSYLVVIFLASKAVNDRSMENKMDSST